MPDTESGDHFPFRNSAKWMLASMITCFAVFGFGRVQVSPDYSVPDPTPDSPHSLQPFVDLLEELDHRRRLQFLFPNPQSIFDGIAIGYIQTSAGNLTFERRDIVVLGQKSTVVSRIYDSRLASGTGFGPGWRLSLLESVNVEDSRANYIDGNGAQHPFKRSDEFLYVPARSSVPFTASTLSVIGNSAVLDMSDGSVRVFSQVGHSNAYRLSSHVSSDGIVVSFTYQGLRLAEVSLSNRPVLHIEWRDNRITGITDRHDRQVTYQYDEAGRLVEVTDIGGQSWRYGYDQNSRMKTAAHPNGDLYLAIEYDTTGKVQRSATTREFEFSYYQDGTTVTEPNGRRHEFQRNDAGITVGYRNNHDVNWELELDDSNRVVGLNKEGAEYRFAYSGLSLTTMGHPAGEQKFHYDSDDRLTHATGMPMRRYDVPRVSYESDGLTTVAKDNMTLSYRHDKVGRLSRISKNEAVYHVVYGPNGFIATLLKNKEFRRFIRNEMGRVSLILYPNGASSQHQYDELGNRSRIDYSNGGSMTISHDGRGNIVNVVDANPDGASVSQSYTIGKHNQVTEISLNDDARLQVSYDYFGRPAKFSQDAKTVAVEYFATGDPIRLQSATSNLNPSSAREKNIVLPVHPSPRRLFHNDTREHGQPDYGVVSISDISFDISIVPVENRSVPGYKEAVSATLAIDSWFDPKTRGKIEKPSNPIFQPPEYESTNCCMSCLWNMQCGQICSKIFMGIGEQTCLCFSVYSSGVGGGGGGCDPNNKATKARAEKVVRKTLLEAPDVEPREIFFTVDCPYSSRVGRTVKSEEYDFCPEKIMNEPPIIYAGHTHPKLKWPDSQNKIVRCRGKYEVMLTGAEMMHELNDELNKCSENDIVNGNRFPLLLRKPDKEIVYCGNKWRE